MISYLAKNKAKNSQTKALPMQEFPSRVAETNNQQEWSSSAASLQPKPNALHQQQGMQARQEAIHQPNYFEQQHHDTMPLPLVGLPRARSHLCAPHGSKAMTTTTTFTTLPLAPMVTTSISFSSPRLGATSSRGMLEALGDELLLMPHAKCDSPLFAARPLRDGDNAADSPGKAENDSTAKPSPRPSSEPIKPRVKKGPSCTFHLALFKLLEDAEDHESGFASIVSWQSHGRAWSIKDKSAFAEQVMKKYFRMSSFASFLRQISNYGFKRISSPGPDHGAYYHESFLRGMPELCRKMERVRRKRSKTEAAALALSALPLAEPDFSAMPPVGAKPTRSLSHGSKATRTGQGVAIPAVVSAPELRDTRAVQSFNKQKQDSCNIPLPSLRSEHSFDFAPQSEGQASRVRNVVSSPDFIPRKPDCNGGDAQHSQASMSALSFSQGVDDLQDFSCPELDQFFQLIDRAPGLDDWQRQPQVPTAEVCTKSITMLDDWFEVTENGGGSG